MVEVSALGSGTAAEVHIADLGALTEPDKQRITAAFDEHRVLVLRQPDLSSDAQRDFVALFGPVLASERTRMVSNVEGMGILGASELAFHSDWAFAETPIQAIALYALDVVNGQTSTRFADGVAAYAALPDALKERVHGLVARHVYCGVPTGIDRSVEPDLSEPYAERPVVWTHPRTGMPVLYVTQMHTDQILGLERDESTALIEELLSYVVAPDNIYEHVWNVGDLVVWDNLATQHARGPADNGPRTLRRFVVTERDLPEILANFNPRLNYGSGYGQDAAKSGTSAA